EEHFDHVRGELEHAERPDAVGAVTVLPQRQQTPLDKTQQRAADHDHQQNHHGLENLDQHIQHFRSQPGHHALAPFTAVTFAPAGTNGTPGKPTGSPSTPPASAASCRSGSVTLSPLSVNWIKLACCTPACAAVAGDSAT